MDFSELVLLIGEIKVIGGPTNDTTIKVVQCSFRR
jgi:hypothetical protein